MTDWSNKSTFGQTLTKLSELLSRMERVRRARLEKSRAAVIDQVKRLQVNDE